MKLSRVKDIEEFEKSLFTKDTLTSVCSCFKENSCHMYALYLSLLVPLEQKLHDDHSSHQYFNSFRDSLHSQFNKKNKSAIYDCFYLLAKKIYASSENIKRPEVNSFCSHCCKYCQLCLITNAKEYKAQHLH